MRKNENETKCVHDDEMPREIYFHVVVASFFHSFILSVCLYQSNIYLFIRSTNFHEKKTRTREKTVSRKNGDNHVNFINHLPKKRANKTEEEIFVGSVLLTAQYAELLGFGNRFVTSERLVVILS